MADELNLLRRAANGDSQAVAELALQLMRQRGVDGALESLVTTEIARRLARKSKLLTRALEGDPRSIESILERVAVKVVEGVADRELLRRAYAGKPEDRSAFMKRVLAISLQACDVAHQARGMEEEAFEDVCSDVNVAWVRLLNETPAQQNKRQINYVRDYTATIVWHSYLNWLKRRESGMAGRTISASAMDAEEAAFLDGVAESGAHWVGERAEGNELRPVMARWFAKLSESAQRIVRLKAGGTKDEEIARELRMTKNAVQIVLHRSKLGLIAEMRNPS